MLIGTVAVFHPRRATAFQQSTSFVRKPSACFAAAQVVESYPGLISEDPSISFESLGIDERLTVTLPKYNIEKPSEIQAKAIPRILNGDTIAIQSFTGSGKTLSFLLPAMTLAVERLEQRVKSGQDGSEMCPEAIIVAPSRELAMQIVRVAQRLLPQEAWPLVQQAIGGANMRRQLESMKSNKPLIVVGTPGRMAEHSRLGSLRTHRTAVVILDEVDQLLCPQFREDLLRIVAHAGTKLTRGSQFVAASATMSPQLLKDLGNLLRIPDAIPMVTPNYMSLSAPDENEEGEHLEQRDASEQGADSPRPEWGWSRSSGFWAGRAGAVATRGSAGGALPEGARKTSLAPQLQHCFAVEVKRHHVDLMRRLVHALNAKKVLVFMNKQQRLKDTMHKLVAKGFSAGCLHGEMGKQRRAGILQKFRTGTLQVLLVSDVAARGLDVEECDLVVNLELPSNAAHYAHRAGRTGRMGKPGVVCSIIEKQSDFVIEKFCKSLHVSIPQCKVQGGVATIIKDGAIINLRREDVEMYLH